MSRPAVRVLGIDTSLRSTGVGVVEAVGNRLSCVECGFLKTSRQWPHSQCLLRIAEGLDDIIRRTRPQEVAIEGAFFCKNVKTAMVLGEARGVAIAACARHGIPVYEYAPRLVKQAVVGVGRAEKDQVAKMVKTMLGLAEQPQGDAADALAIAICHLHRRNSVGGSDPV